jgi:hypothetical protein
VNENNINLICHNLRHPIKTHFKNTIKQSKTVAKSKLIFFFLAVGVGVSPMSVCALVIKVHIDTESAAMQIKPVMA